MLNGKNALVTGSTSGIGYAVARALAREGANVTLNGFGDPAEIDKLRAALKAEADGGWTAA
jgi:3-hydroxybutyrate dehydrogenase